MFALGFALAALAGVLVSMVPGNHALYRVSIHDLGFRLITLGGLGNLFGSLLGGSAAGRSRDLWHGHNLLELSGRSLSMAVFIAVLLVKPQGPARSRGRS